MKKSNIKSEFATVIIVALLFMSMFQMLKVSGANVTYQTESNQISQLMPQQKISQDLKAQMEQDGRSKSQPLRILIRYDPSMKPALPKGLRTLKEFKFVPLISVLASPFEIEELAKLNSVKYIYPDMKKQALSFSPQQALFDYSKISGLQKTPSATGTIPTTPWFGEYPCFLNESTALIKADQLWANGITGRGVIIAILDTGINKNHPDLDDMDDNPATCDPKVLAEQAFIEEPLWEVGDPTDYVGHGTHCASIAAGTGATGAMDYGGTYFGSQIFNGTILPGTERGVAPGAYLYNVKVLNSEGYGYDSWIIAGVEWAMEHGADVISMSLGGPPIGTPEEDPLALALDAAVDHGVVCVVAAGNEGFGYFSVGSPGFDPRVITVGATTETDKLVDFSSRGPEQFELHAKPDIVAPGACIVAAYAFFDEFEDRYNQQLFYWELSGTSMATPHVAGATALLLQAFPGASPYAVKSAIMLSADDLGLDAMAQGAGRLNVAKAHETMTTAVKESWSAPVPTNTITPMQPELTVMPNLTSVSILVENSFCSPWKMSMFINMLTSAGAVVASGMGSYSNDSLVDPGTGQPLYDIFVLSEPSTVDEGLLPPSVLANYVQHNGTVLFTGDKPTVCKDYANWTKQWGISWNNVAVGGVSTNITSHAITDGISEIYFGSPVASLILDADTDPSPECVVWDPVLPGIAVWETHTPSTGKVVVISDDGILSDQYLAASDNLALGLNIIKWFTNASNMYLSGVETPLSSPIESPHPYPANASLWYPVFALGAQWMSVHFAKIDVEEFFDAIIIYDQFMNPVEYYSGYYEDVWTKPVFGNTVWIRLVSDYTIQNWGFLADAYIYGDIAPSMMHEIGVGATWEKYVIANSTFALNATVQNFGNYTEDVMLNLTLLNSTGGVLINDWNFENVTVIPGEEVTIEVTPDVILNATTQCDFTGPQSYRFTITGMIYNSSSGAPPYREIDIRNNLVKGEVSAVPKTARSGPNPLLNVMTPMKITSTSAPLVTMYPKDFTMHNMTAFVSGGKLENAKFQITGAVSQIAGFVNVTEFTYHTLQGMPPDLLPDPSPAYFTLNTTVPRSSMLDVENASAPAVFFAALQVYVAEGTLPGVYAGTIELVNGTTVLASASLSFEVRNPKYKVLWEDYYNDYANEWAYCERLWGGSNWGLGVFEWWKLVSQAGFDVDSLHQEAYLKRHAGIFEPNTLDPLGIIAYGGYNALYLHDCKFAFRPSEISVFRQLYETGKMDFAVMFDYGSERPVDFTSYYGINISTPTIDLLIDKFDKTHPIFDGVNNFTLYFGPLLTVGTPVAGSVTRGIAVGSGDLDASGEGGFVVEVNEMRVNSHLTSRMVAVSDANTFEFLEYEDYAFWLYTWIYTGNSTVAKVDTDKFAVNLLRWLDPQFANESPVVDYFDATPTTVRPNETIRVDIIVHDPDGDSFNVTVAVQKPDSSWDNVTVVPVGGHWLRSFKADLEGAYNVYVIATDSYGATTSMLGATVQAINMRPEIVSASISPNSVLQGKMVFIAVNAKDAEDGAPTSMRVSVVAPNGSSYVYDFSHDFFANVNFNTSSMPEGIYSVNVVVGDSNGAQTAASIGSFEVDMPINYAPTIASHGISPNKVIVGEVVFITVGGHDAEDNVPTNITISVTDPNSVPTVQTFSNMAVASMSFNTASKAIGVYQVTTILTDSKGASTTAVIGYFEVEAVPPAGFPYREATLGVGVIGLVMLVLAVLLLFSKLPGKPQPMQES